jgi:urease accessory protein
MHTELCIDASRSRSPRITSVGGLAGRQTGPDTVHLIGTAATPLGGDTIVVRISVAAGARLEVRSVAASHFEVGAGASLVFDPEPMVVVSDASHSVVNTVALEQDSTLWLRERTQIGRFEEASGHWSSAMRCDVGGSPLLRHRVELGAGSVAHDALSAPLSMSSTLSYPDTRASEVDLADGTVRLALAGGGSLSTSVGRRLQPSRSGV